MDAELVPETQSLRDVYVAEPDTQQSLEPEQQTRWNSLIKQFKRRYGGAPGFVARSPGRVNIIGEHIDYSLYDVLPTALSVDVLVAVKTMPASGPEATIKVDNTDPRFAASEFVVSSDREVDIDASRPDWVNYFKAGLRVAIKYLREKNSAFVPANIEALVDGSVPPGGGISSSAAFVCASALAIVKANGHNISKQELLDISIVSERAVGVYSGGMDQAASIFSRRGYLLYVTFFPKFKVQHVAIPKATTDITFMVAQSFVTSNKAETAPRHYNLRVAECTLAAVILAQKHNITLQKDSSSLGYSLRNLHHELMRQDGRQDDPFEYQLDSLILIVEETFKQEQGYTRADIAELLQLTVPQVEEQFLSSFPVEAERFYLRQRALHCFKEARRVLDFRSCLARSHKLDQQNLGYLGQLLNESQASCRDVYDCTCPEVDELCEIARRAGSLGSRLTGAGWGGCTVHMVPLEKVENVTKALKEEYYLKRWPDLDKEKLNQAMVISKPSNGSILVTGAAITDVQ
ncbi:galactokinase [Trichophyton rubrum D6]|uniref:Galactokinase n=4 Tax=Trichophyton TaxID=5550 RepID=A0A178EW24_TRIRU|nr:galactokinase [Trichophyton rubrum CBS 118892]EZF11106.1 galactokinase [Trichophyton rubrum MR850]EZF37970.1 galactokinase [Trichophyton rubrum CBS 100081]EZF48605.1 galactokinase [Trichophyton rubrum CBS 288.86]EZF59292.1 galactokinase [Trichophyton rubrum CBS 289.86]EZF69859.1 galactokinase [Trichophyton soudanense CBS 452.61]EZF80630.1 galactokinase [Trichophyton rubrum MR1448]EZF91176.1 galactokinase [Trichophyton rubrum MR1459]EZG02310.1 galactokinase [Trichophyton rubrum CBS 735.88